VDKAMPVTIITGDPEGDLAIKSLAYGVSRMLSKPLELKQILSTVQQN
jgi:FixJ family two-component response regulator